MPAWWGRKSGKNKEESSQSSPGKHTNFLSSSKSDGNSSKKKGTTASNITKPSRSFDLGLVAGSSGFSGFDSDSAEKIGHPLPRPSVSDHGLGVGLGLGSGLGSASGSVSVSSVSSSGSSEDHNIGAEQSQFGAGYRGQSEVNFSTRPRSPGPGSRVPTSPTSPLHPRLSGMSLESATGRPEEGRSQCHPLPLPPGSPTSPSSVLPNLRTAVSNDNSPSTLSKWKKGRLLGRGTFGHVYLGFNSESGHMCAIKEVRVISDDQSTKESLKQLNQEINLLNQLSHPNIVRYHGSELGEEALSVYLEYVSGGSIHKLLQEYGAFKEPVIQNYTRQILSGLAYLHGRNTVHRDIKGANILVDPNGEVKLADFGMAKHITAASSMLSFKGSPYWMAPEVVMNTNGYNLAVDIWSLGCTILEMATSKPPWSQYEGVAAIFKIGNSKDMPEIPDGLSYEAKNFLWLCLQRDPSARPTACQLLEHPFIQDQATPRASIALTKDHSPFTFDGSRTPPALDLMPHRTSISSFDAEYVSRPSVIASRAIRSPRENARIIASLPVSPSASPLRQHGPAYKSCLPSPPHPSYVSVRQSGHNFNDYTLNPSRPTTRYTQQIDSPVLRSQTPPNTSPRSRTPFL